MREAFTGGSFVSRGIAAISLLSLAVTPLSAAAQQNSATTTAEVPVAGAATAQTAADVYRLGSGDKVRVTVYNEDTLSGEYEVDGSGNLAIQLIGSIKAVGLSIPELTEVIASKLRDGFILNPSVAVEVLNYRPFYVLGEVKQPGKYPFVSGMTVLTAIALAGGYTYRGKKGFAMVIRANDPDRKEKRLKTSELIMPGDIVRVSERVF